MATDVIFGGKFSRGSLMTGLQYDLIIHKIRFNDLVENDEIVFARAIMLLEHQAKIYLTLMNEGISMYASFLY